MRRRIAEECEGEEIGEGKRSEEEEDSGGV
jgi:hypothetical protein